MEEKTEQAPQFLSYPTQPQAHVPQGVPLAGPKDHKPLYKLMSKMLKPKMKHPKISRPKVRTWKKKQPYY